MEVSALKHPSLPALTGPTPLLRLQSDERLVALTRRGNQGAFEALVARYESRLLAFCRHMLGSREDAEDVLQEVFAASFNAMVADERPINVRPWLYRIARNRSLNHLRRQQAIGVDSMDVHLAEHGTTTADKVHKREEFRQLVGDVQELAETQRTALLLREIDALSYEQIAEAMETTVPSVKSLLVRARMSLAEAAEARRLNCEDVRLELAEVAEGLKRSSPPVRRHVRQCEQCAAFKKQLRETNKALAAIFPVAPLLLFKKLILAHLGTPASAGGAATATATTAATGAAGVSAGGALSAGVGAVASKAAAGLAAAALVTAAGVEVDHVRRHDARPLPVAAAPVTQAPTTVAAAPTPVAAPARVKPLVKKKKADAAHKRAEAKKADKAEQAQAEQAAAAPTATTTTPAPETTEEQAPVTVLPPEGGSGQPVGPEQPVEAVAPPEQQSQAPADQGYQAQPAQQPPPEQQPQEQQQPPAQEQPQQSEQPPPAEGQSAAQDQYSGQ
jgi:RNA polymerase sigma factor (sigma-70 family)